MKFGAVPNLSVSKMQFPHGILDMETLHIQPNSPLILFDLMSKTNRHTLPTSLQSMLITKVSMIFIVQNMVPKGKHARDISLNAHYIVVF